LLPVLETYDPNVREVLRRSAVVAADDYAFLLQQLRGAWDEALVSEGDGWLEFDLTRWRRLPRSLQRGILREAIRRLRHGLRNINWIHVENALEELSRSDTGEATLPQGLAATARYGRFYVAEAKWSPPPDAPQLGGEAIAVPLPGRSVLPDGRWVVDAELLDSPPLDTLQNPDPWQAWLDFAVAGTDLMLRPRKPGESFAPLGMSGRTQRVNECMINAKVPREWRADWPLLCNSRQVLWVAGLRLDERAAVVSATGKVVRIRMSLIQSE
jgi:tRNA(Ile)-lysidine synthase